MIYITTAEPQLQPPTEIVITAVTGDVQHKSGYSLITVNAGAVVTVSGTVSTPDRTFSLPLKWRGGWLLFSATVVDGAFEARLRFPESGVAILDDDCVNKDLPVRMFSTRTVQVDVVTVV